MADKNHHYKTQVCWTGNTGEGTKSYNSYQRAHEIQVYNKPVLFGSADPAFLGDPSKHNPEDLLLASIASCHMLWYLHFCSEAGITVIKYTDNAEATMLEEKSGKGRFTNVILNPIVSILEKDKQEEAIQLHHKANQFCFIANSLNFKVKHNCIIKTDEL